MTQYLQTRTDLFAAAASHAGISSISSYWAGGYWGMSYSTVASEGSYPWNTPTSTPSTARSSTQTRSTLRSCYYTAHRT